MNLIRTYNYIEVCDYVVRHIFLLMYLFLILEQSFVKKKSQGI